MNKLRIPVLLLLLLLLIGVPVFAATYETYIPITVTESDDNSYAYLPVIATVNNTYLMDNGYIPVTSGLGTRVLQSGIALKHMVTDNTTLFVLPEVNAGQSYTTRYALDYSDNLTSMPVIVGYDGYVTIADDAALEPGDNFTVKQTGWIDTTAVGANLTVKLDAFRLYVAASGNITAETSGSEIYDTDDAYATVYGTLWRAQSFAWFGGIISSVQLKLYKIGSPGTLTVSIRAESGGVPTGSDLTSGTIDGDALTTDTNGEWYSIDLPDYDASAGTYTIVARATAGSVGNEVAWRKKDVGDYADGVASYSDDSGATWTTTGSDMVFKVLGIGGSVSADGVSSGNHTVEVTADGTDLKIYIDDVEEGSVAMSADVPDNNSDWLLMQGNSMPYMEDFEYSVDGTLLVKYQPVAIIEDTNLPNRQSSSYNGTITWGANPSGISANVSGLTLLTLSAPAGVSEPTAPDVVAVTSGTDWFEESVSTSMPLYGIFDWMHDSTGLSTLMLYQIALLISATLVGTALAIFGGSVMVAALGTGAVIVTGYGMDLLPLWTVVVYGVLISGILVFQKVYSL
jgi:hypothetical protein